MRKYLPNLIVLFSFLILWSLFSALFQRILVTLFGTKIPIVFLLIMIIFVFVLFVYVILPYASKYDIRLAYFPDDEI